MPTTITHIGSLTSLQLVLVVVVDVVLAVVVFDCLSDLQFVESDLELADADCCCCSRRFKIGILSIIILEVVDIFAVCAVDKFRYQYLSTQSKCVIDSIEVRLTAHLTAVYCNTLCTNKKLQGYCNTIGGITISRRRSIHGHVITI